MRTLRQLYPGVRPAVQDVDGEVEEDEPRRVREDHAHDEREVLAEHRVDEVRADTLKALYRKEPRLERAVEELDLELMD